MNLGERIRYLRQKKKMTGVNLAVRAGLDQSYISKLERGMSGYSDEGLRCIAQALDTTVADLFGSGNVRKVSLPTGRRIPILNYVQAGRLAETGDSLPQDEGESFVFGDGNTVGDELFALIIRGDSMLPEFSDGDIVIIKRSSHAQPGDYVVGSDGSGEATFKRLKVLGSDREGRYVFALVPTNDDYPTLRSDEQNLKIVGYMVEHRRYRRRRA